MMIRTLVVASLLAAGPVAAETMLPSQQFWDEGDYRSAVSQALSPARTGDARAQFLLGEAYKNGLGVLADGLQAEGWLSRAAENGHVAAARELGLLYLERRQMGQAVDWLGTAAKGGDARAMCLLAVAYFNGDSIPKDWARAYGLMLKAAATGLPEAQERLSRIEAIVSAADKASGRLMAFGATPPPAPDQAAAVAAVAIAAVAPQAAPRAASVTPSAAPVAIARQAVAVAEAAAPTRTAPGMADGRPGATPVLVQLGAFNSLAAARLAWSTLAPATDLARQNIVITRANSIFRLSVMAPDTQQASSLCRQLRAGGRSCFLRLT